MERLVDIAGGPEAPRIARHVLQAAAPFVPDVLLDDLRLLVSEVVTNSVRHGASGEGTMVRLKISCTDREARIEVTDRGPGFLAPNLPSPRPDRAGGWGLVLIDRIADRWGVDTAHGTTVWFEIDIDGVDAHPTRGMLSIPA
jgi:anti-sigma regulatory factor (Ser/Thr protein kinase)